MARYLIRVVLHGATAVHYSMLHDQMERAGAKRRVIGTDGVVYDLPDAEYVLESAYSTTKVRDAVIAIACGAKAKPDPSVLVAAYNDLTWQLRPVPGQS
ncbi:hypothetical protein [Brevundimonas sp. Marseille-Q4549]